MEVIARPPDCANIGARTVENEDISPLMLLCRVCDDIYPNVPRPWIVEVIAGWRVETEEM